MVIFRNKYFKFIFLFVFVININIPFFVFAETIPIVGECGSLNSTDLSTQMAHEIDSRISGVTVSDSTKMLWSTRGDGTGGWERSNTVWTSLGTSSLDFTGASPWNDYSGMTLGATLISPRHIVVAHHAPVVNGSTVIFVDNENNIISRTVASVAQIQVGSDMQIAVLNEDVPSSIAYYPIVDLSILQNYWKNVPNTPLIILDQEDKAIIKEVGSVFLGIFYYLSSVVSPRSEFDETLIVGDSGNPVFGVIGGRLVLLSSVYTETYGTSFSSFINDINSAMTMLGGGYQVSTLDLSCFIPQSTPVFEVESTTFSIAENSANGVEIGSVLATSNDALTYSFTSGNTGEAFAVNAGTGVITVNNQSLLDYESTPTYTLTLKAEIIDSPWYWPIAPDYDTTTVIVNLTDVNEGGGGSSGGGGGGGRVKNKKIVIASIDVVCPIGNKYSSTSGKICTTFTSNTHALGEREGNSTTCFITLTLRQGNKGEQVKCLQTKLNIFSDGSFGPMTKAAVINFQRLHNLVPDGVFGPKSRALL